LNISAPPEPQDLRGPVFMTRCAAADRSLVVVLACGRPSIGCCRDAHRDEPVDCRSVALALAATQGATRPLTPRPSSRSRSTSKPTCYG